MAHLFSPLRIGRIELRNRIVMGPLACSYTFDDGFIDSSLIDYYTRRARGGVALIFSEPVLVSPPDQSHGHKHIGLYHDGFMLGLRRLAHAIQEQGARFFVTLDDYADLPDTPHAYAAAVDRFANATWRAYAAGCDGVMLTAADGGILHRLISPSRAQNISTPPLPGTDRLRLILDIIERIRAWMGRRMILGFRLIGEEFHPGGLTLQDTRVIAKRIASAGIRLFDVAVDQSTTLPVARFPGWAIPLAAGIKRVLPEIPVIGSGQLGDPHIANSIISDGSVDLVALGAALRTQPDWPLLAQAQLNSEINFYTTYLSLAGAGGK